MRQPVSQSCYWLATRAGREPGPPLRGAHKADIVIIGAGFTGLWSALFLSELAPEREVVLVEQETPGYGASGRNAGIVSASIDHSHELAIAHFGQAEAQKLAALGQQNLAELVAFASGCDFEPSGQLIVALTPEHLEAAQATVDTARALGLDGYRLLSREQVRKELDSPLYQGAVSVPDNGIVNPIKLIDKLLRTVQQRGVRLYESSRVHKLDGTRLQTEHGSLDAQVVLLATDAYSHHLVPGLARRFIPLYDYILTSEPLTASQLGSIGWAGRQGVTDGRTFFNYYRLTADNRILFGTSEAHYFGNNRVDPGCDHSEAHYLALRQSFFRHFPQLSGLEFPYAWGGPIASTTRLTPFFGSRANGRVHYGLGYTGHGIGSTRVAGRILAHLALSRPSELLALAMVRRKPFPYPPEPLRRLAVAAVTRSLRRRDEGAPPGLLLRLLDRLGIGFSS